MKVSSPYLYPILVTAGMCLCLVLPEAATGLQPVQTTPASAAMRPSTNKPRSRKRQNSFPLQAVSFGQRAAAAPTEEPTQTPNPVRRKYIFKPNSPKEETGNRDGPTTALDNNNNNTKKRLQNLPARLLRQIVPPRSMIPELVAESFGTFLLLQLALGIVLSQQFANSMQGIFPIALLTGAAITAASATVGGKCAAHFNPAITWSMCLYRKFGWNKLLPYWMAQIVGATTAALVNYGMYASRIAEFEAKHGIVRSSLVGGLQTAKSMGCYFSHPISPVAAFLAEAFGTFMLSTVVFSVTSKNNDSVKGLFIPPIIGSTVALIISIVGPISCASLNPARELGPRLVMRLFGWSSSVAFSQMGLYLAAAMVGATAGGLFVEQVLYPNHPRKAVEPKRESVWE